MGGLKGVKGKKNEVEEREGMTVREANVGMVKKLDKTLRQTRKK